MTGQILEEQRIQNATGNGQLNLSHFDTSLLGVAARQC